MRLVLVTAAALVLASSAPAATAGQATLRLVSDAPLALRGLGFEPREQVTVTVAMRGGPATKRVTAGATGRFAVAFARTPKCGTFVARAIGSKGSRATLRQVTQLCVEPGPGG